MKKILECRKGRRCNRPLSCKHCAENWQRGKFKGFCQCLETLQQEAPQQVFFITIGTKKIGNLKIKLTDMFQFIEEVKELKKRGKLGIFYGRLEVSFNELGLYPHFHFLVWGDCPTLKTLSADLDLKFRKRKAKNIKNIEKGEAVITILGYQICINWQRINTFFNSSKQIKTLISIGLNTTS